MSQQVEIGILCQFGKREFGFIEIPSRDGTTPQKLYCDIGGFRRPEAQGEEVIFLTPEEIDPAGMLVGQLEKLASQRTPVAFIRGRNNEGPCARYWCVAATLGTAERELTQHLTKFAELRQAQLRDAQTRIEDLGRQVSEIEKRLAVGSEILKRLSAQTLEEALATGWKVYNDRDKRQVIMRTPDSRGVFVYQTFHRKRQTTTPRLQLRKTG